MWPALRFFNIFNLVSCAIVMPQSGHIDLEPTFDFELKSTQGQTIFSYRNTPQPFTRQLQLWSCSTTNAAEAGSVQVNRAEAGTILSFYGSDPLKPIFVLSFPISVYEPVVVTNLTASGHFGSVQVQANSQTDKAVKRVELSRSPIPYLVL